MKRHWKRCWRRGLGLAVWLAHAPGLLANGPFAPEVGRPGSTAVAADDPAFQGWATEVVAISYGESVNEVWRTPENALGPGLRSGGDAAQGVVTLGRGGRVVLAFGGIVADGPGWDFAVFENSFSDFFLELAFVEVSSNGTDFLRFPARSLTAAAVPAFGLVDPTQIDGLAGKYRLGFGTPFDLATLRDQPGASAVDLDAIRYLRLVDVVGDGSARDADGRAVYDPYPTQGSAGFDLDAVGVRFPEGGPLPAEAPVVSLAWSSAARVVVRWEGEVGQSYQLQRSAEGLAWETLYETTPTADTELSFELDWPSERPLLLRVLRLSP